MKLLFENWRQYLNEDLRDVQQAFANADPSYLETSVNQRNPGPSSAGSTFLEPMTVQELTDADWTPYEHPNIMKPAVAYRANIPGILGIADIDSLSEDQPVRFQPAHAGKALVDDKNSPKHGQQLAEAVAVIPDQDREVDHTTLILGPSKDDPQQLTMWTFFPGDPTPKFPDITMEEVRATFGSEEQTVVGTVSDAKSMGYNFVKHVEQV
tara:strand:+ start:773 stop:1402 length:630 start_codon:yes stop_codon:yes gene_type:complete